MNRLNIVGLAIVCMIGFGGASMRAAPAPPVAAAAQSVDYKRGKLLFIQCRACHELKPGAEPKVGPNLAGMFGRKAGSGVGFSYSAALRAASFSWDAAALDRWLTKPSAVVPGNVMAFVGIPDAKNRAALISYLQAETAVNK